MSHYRLSCHIWATLLFTAVAAVAPSAVAQEAPQQPNIVLIVLDTVRWDALTMANPDLNTSPHLAALAEEGVLFDNAYSTRDWTLPSHFSLLTGIHQRHDSLEIPSNSIAHHLKSIGYEVMGVSANGLITSRRSFIEPFERFVTPYWYFEEQIATNAEYQQEVAKIFDYYNAPSTLFSSATLLCSAENIRDIANKMVSERSDKPLFMFLNFMEAHDPYFPAPEYYDVEQDGFLVDFYSDMRTRYIKPWDDYIEDPKRLAEIEQKFEKNCHGLRWKIAADLTPEKIAVYRKRYEASIRQLDDQIRLLMEDFKKQGLHDNTMYIITSDHGEHFGEDDYMLHNFNNNADKEASRHVPLLFSYPKLGRKGLVVSEETSIADVVPTLHEILGIEYDVSALEPLYWNTYGKSLNQYLQCETAAPAHQFELIWRDQELDREKRRQGVVEQLESLGYLE